MKIEKNGSKVKSTGRKAVVQAIAKQDTEAKAFSKDSQEIQEAIQVKAYELFMERGANNGSAEEDWLTAERIVLQNCR